MSSEHSYGIRRLVLDVMKPHKPSIVDVALKLSKVSGVNGVNCILNEVDQETESIKVVIEGPHIDFDEVQETLESLGAVIHSIDVAVAGKKIVEDVETPQDR